MTCRRYLTAKAKAEIYWAQYENCDECGDDVTLGNIEWDHILPLCLGGSNDEDNWHGLCRKCHAKKTRHEAAMRAKADRIRKAWLGEKKRRGRKMQSRGFDTRWRKRMNGRVEVRT
jgi:5-methylcytosine-specific restriction endonuclease McrA